MGIFKRLAVILLVSFCCIGCDQASKQIASNHLPKNAMQSYFGDTVRVGYTENRGAFLGLGKKIPENTRFLVFTVLVSGLLTVFFLSLVFTTPHNIYSLIALSLMLSGGASNLYDRIINNGAVVDFLNLGIGPVRTGVFNVADMAILFGVTLFLYSTYRTADTKNI